MAFPIRSLLLKWKLIVSNSQDAQSGRKEDDSKFVEFIDRFGNQVEFVRGSAL